MVARFRHRGGPWGRFGAFLVALSRRKTVDARELIAAGTIVPEHFAREVFAPDITDGPEDTREPAYHPEGERTSHEAGNPEDPQPARESHNHDFTSASLASTRVKGDPDSDYVEPFEAVSEGIHPAALPHLMPGHWRLRRVGWSIKEGFEDRITPGPVEVWVSYSIDGGVTYFEPFLAAVVPPGITVADFNGPAEVDFDETHAASVVARIKLLPRHFDRDTALKLVRTGFDGKIESGYLPSGEIGDASWKRPVRVATAAALPANTRTGNVLEANANGTLNVDGVSPLIATPGAEDRVLVKDEAAPENNGIYIVTNPGAAGGRWKLTRASDADEDHEVKAGLAVMVNEGTVNADTFWRLTTDDPIVVNTTGLTFAQLGGTSDLAKLTGRPGGQTLQGGTAASEKLVLESTANATKGEIEAKDSVRMDKGEAQVGIITPTALAGNTDNWAPTGLSTARVIRVSATGAVDLTGIDVSVFGTPSGTMLRLVNVGANTITLKNNVTSSASNRFLMVADFSLVANEYAEFWYDSSSSRWRKVG